MMIEGGRLLLGLLLSLVQSLPGLLVGWTFGCLDGLRMEFGWLVGEPAGMVFLWFCVWRIA